MQLDEYSAVKSLQLDVPRNERERTRLLNLRSDARENVIRFAASEEDARNIIVMLGLGDDDELLNMAVAEPVPSDASPVARCKCLSGCGHDNESSAWADFITLARRYPLRLGNRAA